MAIDLDDELTIELSGNVEVRFKKMPSSYPATVVAAAWDARAVWDLQLPGNAGHRTLTKVYGVAALPPGTATYGAHFYVEGGNVIFNGWDFSTLPGNIYVQGSAVFTDCLFKSGASAIYNLEVKAAASAACNHCTFDGTNNANGASNYIVRAGGMLMLNRCKSTFAKQDTGKSQGIFVAVRSLWLPFALEAGAHLDGHQMDQGTAAFADCLFDARFNTTVPMTNYIRIESNGGVIGGVTVERCICVGQSVAGGYDPFQIHVNPHPISNVKFIDSLWQRGMNGHYFYPTTPAGSIIEWSGNKDFDTGVIYPEPV